MMTKDGPLLSVLLAVGDRARLWGRWRAGRSPTLERQARDAGLWGPLPEPSSAAG